MKFLTNNFTVKPDAKLSHYLVLVLCDFGSEILSHLRLCKCLNNDHISSVTNTTSRNEFYMCTSTNRKEDCRKNRGARKEQEHYNNKEEAE